MTPEQEEKNKKLLRWLAAGALLMFGFGFALVPIYNVLCKQLGINGKIDLSVRQAAIQEAELKEDFSRNIWVEFVTTMNEQLPWEFYPLHRRVQMHPGGVIHTAYYAKNTTDETMTIQAIPSVTPGRAATYIKKLECFCYEHQTLAPGESAEMPLVFILEDKIPEDINTLTLSYTLFDLTKQS
jgi:cytochrome c oxidase assembly protein subunit 11